jgi:hypothetical protein
MLSQFFFTFALIAAAVTKAEVGVPGSYFTDNNGIEAAKAAAP